MLFVVCTFKHHHIKLVYVPAGIIIDVVLDIRKNSSTFGEYFSCELSSSKRFKSLQDNTNVTYMQTSCYVPNNDMIGSV